MEEPATWEKVLVAILALALIFFMRPGLKAAMERSKHVEKDWAGALLPIGVVVLFVIFLIMMV
ncbi:MAG TPA: hypothetical protein ENK29_03040 [Chromatiales bacterium]|nr:hypothetical protein [Chromatiales bacterium]